MESDNGLNLRAQPNAGSEVLYVLPYGMVLTVLGEGENGFLYVQWGGYTGCLFPAITSRRSRGF